MSDTRIEWVGSGNLDEVIALSRRLHEESCHDGLPFDEHRLRQSFEAALSDGGNIYFLALARSVEGPAVGCFFGTIVRPHYSQALLAHDCGFYVVPQFRGTDAAPRLLKAFTHWAKKRGVAEIQIYQTVAIEPERFDRFMRRSGFQFVGGNYALQLGFS
jgi:GNAT superfamily N-acetyltransferase